MAVRAHPVHPSDWYRWCLATRTFVLVGESGGGLPRATGIGRPGISSDARLLTGARRVVAAVPLDPIEGAVGRRDQLGGGPAVDRERRHPDRCADGHGAALLADEGVLVERVEDPLGRPARLIVVGLGQDDRELVAAVACRDVRGAQ